MRIDCLALCTSRCQFSTTPSEELIFRQMPPYSTFLLEKVVVADFTGTVSSLNLCNYQPFYTILHESNLSYILPQYLFGTRFNL